MNRRRPLLAVACVCAVLPLAPLAHAQEASPAAGTPAAEAITCSAEPRNVDELVALWFNTSGTPVATPGASAPMEEAVAIPEGERADDATVQAITKVTQEWIMCGQVLGQNVRAFNLMTDKLASQFGPDLTNPAQDTPAEVRQILETQSAATPIPLPQVTHIPGLAGPRRATVLPDGRVAALWSFAGDKALFVYAKEGDRWLIDENVDVSEAAATPEATPAS
jgi:hypothetical protein